MGRTLLRIRAPFCMAPAGDGSGGNRKPSRPTCTVQLHQHQAQHLHGRCSLFINALNESS